MTKLKIRSKHLKHIINVCSKSVIAGKRPCFSEGIKNNFWTVTCEKSDNLNSGNWSTRIETGKKTLNATGNSLMDVLSKVVFAKSKRIDEKESGKVILIQQGKLGFNGLLKLSEYQLQKLKNIDNGDAECIGSIKIWLKREFDKNFKELNCGLVSKNSTNWIAISNEAQLLPLSLILVDI